MRAFSEQLGLEVDRVSWQKERHTAGCSGGIQTGMLLRSEMHQNTAKAVMESSFFSPWAR